MYKSITYLTAILFSLSLFTGCGNDSTGPQQDNDKGTLKVKVNTEGKDKDADGYTITLDDGQSKPADSSATVTFNGVTEGQYTVKLSGLADNCFVENSISQQLAVFSGKTVTGTYTITCKKKLRDKIVFSGGPKSTLNYNLYIINTDGSGQKQLTNDNLIDYGPNISPNGTQIAYAQFDGEKERTEYRIIDADGSGDTMLAEFNKNLDTFSGISWSPDGQKLAFTGIDSAERYQIYQVNADGTGLKTLVSGDSLNFLSNGGWSSDGKKLVFTSRRSAGTEYHVFTINTDGTNLKQLTDNDANNAFASWSPDGSTIAFYSDRTNGDIQLFTMNAQGKSVTPILDNVGDDALPVSWSPDGTKLYYSSIKTGDIFSRNSDGTGPETNLTSTPDFIEIALSRSPLTK